MKKRFSNLFGALSTDMDAIKSKVANIVQNPKEAFIRLLGSPAGLTLMLMFTAVSGNLENILKAAGSSAFTSALLENKCNRAAPPMA